MEANPRRSGPEPLRDRDSRELADTTEIHFPDGFPWERLEQTRRWIAGIRSAADSSPPIDCPFLVLTPLGMLLRDTIASWLTENNYTVVRRVPIPDWPATATTIYPRALNDERMTVALCFEALWRTLGLAPNGEQWYLADAHQIQRLDVEKQILRTRCGCRRFKVRTPIVTFDARLQALHVPDPDRYPQEAAILTSILSQRFPDENNL